MSTQTVQNDFITHDVSGYYLRNTLSEICEDRKVLPPKEDSCHWKAILDEVKGENDECMFIYSPRRTGFSSILF